VLAPGARVTVGTALAVQIPDGVGGLVLPRSGVAIKHGVTLVNSPGLIDPGFRGEIRVLMLNTDQTVDFRIAPGDRIAQLLLVPLIHATPLQAEGLDQSTRGEGGFGSSGL
jgi:dUTP diphosphatase